MSDFEVYQRSTGNIIKEQVFGAGALKFICNNFFGKMLTGLVIKRKFVSQIVSRHYKTRRSARIIPDFIEKYGIPEGELDRPVSEYKSFNEFFTRRLARDISCEQGRLISPADSRLMVHRISSGTVFSVKGQLYTVAELLASPTAAAEYENGLCLVFRLCPTDYHRYCFPDKGYMEDVTEIKGFYRSVNTFFESPRVHVSNYREKTTLHTEHFGDVEFVEVGAMLIGKIVNTFKAPGEFNKGQEKGYFEYGASTIVMLLNEGAAEIDSDIMEQSALGRECLVRYGEGIGRAVGAAAAECPNKSC